MESKKESTDLVYGKHSVIELIKNSTVQVNKIWMSETLKDEQLKTQIISFAKQNKVPFNFVPQQKLDSLTNNKNHQGVVLSTCSIKYLTVKEVIQASLSSSFNNESLEVILVAHEIEDPHNLGAIIRTFVASGNKSIILTGKRNTGITSTVIKTSGGALFNANFARTANCVNVINELKENDFWIYGAANVNESKSIYETKFSKKIAIVVGNEHEGLGNIEKKNCDFLIKIPIADKVESLNVSVATGVILFEIMRQGRRD